MKIGVYFHGYPPEKGGGHTFEQEILHSLSRLAQQCRHELVLFFENAPGEDTITQLAEKGLEVFLLKRVRRVPMVQRVMVRILKKLHLPSPEVPKHPLREGLERERVEFIWFAADSYIPVHEVDPPFIATVWDIQHRLQPWFPEVSQSGIWLGRENFYSTFLRRAAYILTPNIISQNELCLFYGLPPDRLRLLPYPSPRIDLVQEAKVKAVLEKYHLDRGYLFYPAGFWPHKNHANLLFALQLLKNTCGEIKQLVLVGSDKGNLEYIRNLAKTLGLEDQVHFLGFVPRDELIALYQGAFALTFLSLMGPENLPPLEAFQCGCPVIVSNYSGAKQQYGDAALFVDGTAPEEIAKVIQELERQPDLRLSLIERGRKRGNIYTGNNYVRDVFRIFDEFEPVRHTWGSIY
jgi:glycosyltransferase involved in cell wall biosynthesis